MLNCEMYIISYHNLSYTHNQHNHICSFNYKQLTSRRFFPHPITENHSTGWPRCSTWYKKCKRGRLPYLGSQQIHPEMTCGWRFYISPMVQAVLNNHRSLTELVYAIQIHSECLSNSCNMFSAPESYLPSHQYSDKSLEALKSFEAHRRQDGCIPNLPSLGALSLGSY